MTRKELRDTVVLHTNRSDKLDLINTALNLALKEICRTHFFKNQYVEESVTISIGDNQLAIPDSSYQLMNVRFQLDGQTMISPFELRDKLYVIKRFTTSSLLTGTPAIGYEENGIIKFFPIASNSATFYISYVRLPDDMVQDTDVPSIDFLDQALIAWTTYYVYRSIQMTEEAQMWFQEYSRALLVAIKGDQRQDGNHRKLEGHGAQPQLAGVEPWRDPFAGHDGSVR